MAARRALTLIAVVLGLGGLAVSVALAIDHLGPAPAFCAEGGCAAVRTSAWSRPLGIPLPFFGIAFYAVTLALLAIAPRAARWRRAWMLAGGAIGAGLIAVQAVAIGTFCPLCLVTDGASIVLAVIALVTMPVPPRRRGAALIAGLGAAAVAVPVVLAARAPAPVAVAGHAIPDVVAREQRPGALTIVEFVDFECPFCRDLHTRLTAALAEVGRPVRIVRKMVPLPAHPGALPAALAWCCADTQGKGDAMANALLAADPSELTPEGCEAIAVRLGLDMARYRETLAAPATLARVRSDTAAARAAGVKYLPTVYVGTSSV